MAKETFQPSAPYYPVSANHQPSGPSHTIINVSNPNPAPILYVGGCPSCRVGVLRKSHCTFCGILWSILLFPIGLFCLCCCTKDRCTNCSYSQ